MSAQELRFFSIIIPAHNEEGYISSTLEHVNALSYPRDMYEVLVVENGSSDATLALSEHYANDVIKVFQNTQTGVSKAKNYGVSHAHTQADWFVFLDADTLLLPSFLNELNTYLDAHTDARVGTTAVYPSDDDSLKAKAWFAFYNIGHWLTKTSFSIQLCNAVLRDLVRYDEKRHFGEDLAFIKDARTHGGFVFLWTRSVLTSTRRFKQIGWVKQCIKWLYQANILMHSSEKHNGYDPIR